MNKDNYATLKESARLYDAGIDLFTDAIWLEMSLGSGIYELCNRNSAAQWHKDKNDFVPAPMVAEVWAELPEGVVIDKLECGVCVSYTDNKLNTYHVTSDNITDALIDLLIWLKG